MVAEMVFSIFELKGTLTVVMRLGIIAWPDLKVLGKSVGG